MCRTGGSARKAVSMLALRATSPPPIDLTKARGATFSKAARISRKKAPQSLEHSVLWNLPENDLPFDSNPWLLLRG